MHILLDRHSRSLFIHFHLIISLLSQNSLISSLRDFPFNRILHQQTAQDTMPWKEMPRHQTKYIHQLSTKKSRWEVEDRGLYLLSSDVHVIRFGSAFLFKCHRMGSTKPLGGRSTGGKVGVFLVTFLKGRLPGESPSRICI